jgi:hypothetical protein
MGLGHDGNTFLKAFTHAITVLIFLGFTVEKKKYKKRF